MYAGNRMRGMGDIDWTSVINGVVNTAGKTVQTVENQIPIGYNGYPVGSTVPGTIGGMDLTTLALLGVGAFFLIKVMKR